MTIFLCFRPQRSTPTTTAVGTTTPSPQQQHSLEQGHHHGGGHGPAAGHPQHHTITGMVRHGKLSCPL